MINTTMDKPKFVYVTHIATTPEKLWAALTGSEFWRKFSGPIESDWKVGSSVKFFLPDGKLYSEGQVLKSNPPHTLSHTWPDPEGEQDSDSSQRLTWQIEPSSPGTVRLTMIHENMTENGYRGVTAGWPAIISSLKTLLETGRTIQFPVEC